MSQIRPSGKVVDVGFWECLVDTRLTRGSEMVGYQVTNRDIAMICKLPVCLNFTLHFNHLRGSENAITSSHNPKVIGSNPVPATKKP
jgi:hypothetical protein